MTAEQIQIQRETDQEILSYVRGMQASAPIREEAIERFLVQVRRRRIDMQSLRDRLVDLEDRQLLRCQKKFVPGEGWVGEYQVTAKARNMLDGAVAWDWDSREG